MKKFIKITAKPKLKAPVMIAAWPGVGNVAMLLANYMLDNWISRSGKIDASLFFDPIGVLARDHIIEAPQFPQSHFYTGKIKKARTISYCFSVTTSRM